VNATYVDALVSQRRWAPASQELALAAGGRLTAWSATCDIETALADWKTGNVVKPILRLSDA